MAQRKRRWGLWLALLLPVMATAQDYQLTGVIAASDGGKAFAVIELSDGQQRLLREGERLGDGYVAAIDARRKTVQLNLPGGNVLLTLDGSAFADDYQPEYSIQDYRDGMGQLELKPATVDALLALATEARNLGEKESSRRLNELLNLSGDARIAALDEQQVDSSIQLVEDLAVKLRGQWQGNHVATLSVAEAGGGRRLYLHRNDPNATP